jgi:hypothetical protein
MSVLPYLPLSLTALFISLRRAGETNIRLYRLYGRVSVLSTSLVSELTPCGSGFGRQMINTPMVILWPNGDGTITVSQRQASGHTMPQVVDAPPRLANVSMASSSVSNYLFGL